MGKLLEKHKYYNYQIVGSIQVFKNNDFRAPEEDIIFKSTYYKNEKAMLKAMKQITSTYEQIEETEYNSVFVGKFEKTKPLTSTYEQIEETEYNSVFVGKFEKTKPSYFMKYMRVCFAKYIVVDEKHDRTYITSFRFYSRKKHSNRGKKYVH